MSIKDLVKGKRVRFEYYRDGNLWYDVVGEDFLFPVPIDDVGTAMFKREDKAILFMRYIRKFLKEQNEDNPWV